MKSFKNLKLDNTVVKRLPAALRQPQWIAAIVSLGFHGVLFAAGPSFSSLQGVGLGGNDPNTTERRVPVIELTAEEQNRLPDFSSSAYSLAPGDNSELFDLFPPSGNSLSSSLPLNPGVGLSSIPDVPMTRPPLGSPSLSISPFPSSMGRNSIVIPSTRSPRRLPTLNRPRPTEDEAVASNRPRPGDTSASTPTSNRPTPADQPTAADLVPNPEDDRPSNNNNNDDAPLNARSDDDNNNDNAAAETGSPEAIARVEYSDQLTTEAEVEAAQTAWASAVEERLGEPATAVEEPLSLEVPYDFRICLTPEPTDGLLGLVALPGEEADTISLSTAVLKSTGYPFLNEAAMQRLQTQAAEAETPLEIGVLYRAVVKVNYDSENCVNTETLLKSRTEASEDGATPPARSTAEPNSQQGE